ncbi:unnamed protein product [Periconia digitata]|uniref:F-box domain-containing protein n=1 Tax=Periconia digitata TaxID=1303443 RepID=A0A9W4XYV9_9PLEO|nr:unnamed protein product [Periconia digitata]
MFCEKSSSDQSISRLGYQPGYILRGMISLPEPAKSSAIKRNSISSSSSSSSSSVGLLDILPVELVHCTLSLLDFQSLSHLSRVSLRGYELVRSLPAYRNLIEHAPHSLAALSHIRLIRRHSSQATRRALLSERNTAINVYAAK